MLEVKTVVTCGWMGECYCWREEWGALRCNQHSGLWLSAGYMKCQIFWNYFMSQPTIAMDTFLPQDQKNYEHLATFTVSWPWVIIFHTSTLSTLLSISHRKGLSQCREGKSNFFLPPILGSLAEPLQQKTD